MKTYIFITYGIEGINGAVIYIRNKKLFLERNGWNVKILYTYKGTVYIDELQDCKDWHYFMRFSPCYYNKHRLKKYVDILEKACGRADKNDECIVESHNFCAACWGEELAKRLEGKHIFLSVRERPVIESERYYEFLDFKLRRNELFGMSVNTIQLMYQGYRKIDASEELQLKTPCDNTVQDVPTEYLDYVDPRADYRVCTVTRLDKPYIIPMIEGVIRFATKYEKKIQLFIIAGAFQQSSIDRVEKAFMNQNNVSHYITGFLYPVPATLLYKMDLAICCAGSTLTTYRAGVPTISVDVTDFQPIGIYGVTTHNTHYRMSGESKETYEKLMKLVLMDRIIEPAKLLPDYSDVDEQLQSHMVKIYKTVEAKEYFDVSNIDNSAGHLERRIKISKLLSPEFYQLMTSAKGFLKKNISTK